MPKNTIDYTNTIIYKLCCKNTEIVDIYIGHTTNFLKRKYAHKKKCMINSIGKSYVHIFITENGGWENWDMIEIERIKCVDKIDACKQERKWVDELKPKLNIYRPIRLENEGIEHSRKKCREYWEKNKEQIKERKHLYRINNLEKVRLQERISGEKKRLKKKIQEEK
jgi:hypothetical protein